MAARTGGTDHGAKLRAGRPAAPRQTRLTREAAQDQLVKLVQAGATIASALERVGYARKTYEEWRRTNPVFRERMDAARQLRSPDREVKRGERLDYVAWRRKYLGIETPWHQQQWVDILEGREPRDLHPSQTFIKGRPDRALMNCPPNHGKSISMTVDYVVYRLCMDPGFRVLIISAGRELAKDFLFGIKQRLTSPDFIDMQKAYAPDGGWESTAESWSETKIVFSIEHRSTGSKEYHEKDANVLALGMGSQVYGRRADLAIVDDAVDTTNVGAHVKQLKWLRSMVESRLDAGGKLIVVGTRVAPVDLYSELLNPDNYSFGQAPWTYLASPAILEEGETPDDHVTLWPYAEAPWVPASMAHLTECLCGRTAECSAGVEIDGKRMYPRWDGIHLERGPRAANNTMDWALIYQQSSVAENATFPEHAVSRSVKGTRKPGPLKIETIGHPFDGMMNKYVVAGLDPSIKGFAAITVIAVERSSQKRYLLDAYNMKAPTKAELEARMKEVTELYRVDEWRVEKTGLLQFFTQDQQLRTWFATRGVRFTEHMTNAQTKWDAAYGVSSLGPLFGEYEHVGDEWRQITPPLIELPQPVNEAMKSLMHQLITWTPETDPNKTPCDLVMALWFTEIGCREYLNGRSLGSRGLTAGRSNKFVSPRAIQKSHSASIAGFRSLSGIN